MVLDLVGKVHASKDSLEFKGHHVLISYVTQKGDESTRESGELSSEILSDGSFSLILPDNLVEGIVVEIISPDGEVLESHKFPKDQIKDGKIVIDCDPKKYFSIPPSDDPSLGKKLRRITGIVLDEAGLQKISNKQIILYGFPKDRSNKEEVILATTTNTEGYFAGDYPKDDEGLRTYSKAYGVVAAGNPQRIPVTIDKDDLIARKITLIISFPKQGSVEEPKGKEECESCKVPVPRLPDVEDLINSPSTYTTDLGGGKCINLNLPNRSIEEYDFYTVIRTTEPQIFGQQKELRKAKQMGNYSKMVTKNFTVVDAAAIAIATKAEAELQAVTSSAEDASSQAEDASNDLDNKRLAADKATNAVAKAEADKASAEEIAKAASAKLDSAKQAVVDANEKLSAAIKEAIVTTGFSWNLMNQIEQNPAVKAARIAADAAKVNLDKQNNVTKEAADDYSDALQTLAAAKLDAATADTEVTAASIVYANNSAAAKRAAVKLAAKKLHVADVIAESQPIHHISPAGRDDMNKSNPVQWDGDVTFYQSTSVAHGHILHIKQTWQADGYSLGDLLYSLPLAPCQKKQVAIVDWERRESASRTEDQTAREGLEASLGRDRDINEIVGGALSENLKGGSTASTAGIAGGQGGAISGSYEIINFGAVHGMGGGFGTASSDAWQLSAKNIAANSLQNLHDKTSQAASAFRNLRSTVVTTVTQGETMRVESEVVANHNHCHAITMEYFEVLRHLQVTSKIVDVRECLFIPLLRSSFHYSKVLRWRRLLEKFLQRPELLRGFDAIQRVKTNWLDVDIPPGQYADAKIISISGELHITFSIPLPPLPPKREGLTVTEVAEALAPTRGFFAVALGVLTGGTSVAVGELSQAAAQAATRVYENFANEESETERYQKFHRNVMPGLARDFVDKLQLFAVVNDHEMLLSGMDFTLVSDYRPDGQLSVSVRGHVIPSIIRSRLTNLVIRSEKGLPEGCRVIINDASFKYRTNSFEHLLTEESKLNDDIGLPLLLITPPAPGSFFPTIKQVTSGDGATLSTPTDAWEQQNPRLEDLRLSRELIDHLNSDLIYYHNVIWWNMDEKRRFNLLDGFLAPNSNGKSVASVVENRLIGIVGNSLVMPVALGTHLDPTYHLDPENPLGLIALYGPIQPIEPLRITIPTKGVFAESVMGSCNSCEEKDDTKLWRFEESPCGDEPTLIQPISTESRRAEPASLTPQPLPTPMISIQNAPSAPDPTGLSESLKLLGISGLFKDITGLDQNQKNALQALISSLETAKSFGSEASKLVQGQQKIAQQKASMENSDKAMKAIRDAEKEGLIDKEDSKRLTNTMLGNMIGEDKKSEKSLTDRPEVKNLLGAAAQSPQSDVLLTSPDESVNIKTSSSPLSPNERRSVPPTSSKLRAARATAIPVTPGKITWEGSTALGTILFSNFDVNSSELKPEFFSPLQQVANMLNSSPDAKAYLEGRASQTGAEAFNVQLSQARAEAIYNWLVNDGNVDYLKIYGINSLGSTSPLVIDDPNTKSKELPINRSVTVVFSLPVPTRPTSPPIVSPGDPNSSMEWSIMIENSLSYFELLGGTVMGGYLKNRKSGEIRRFAFVAIGAGLSLEVGGKAPIGKLLEKLLEKIGPIGDFLRKLSKIPLPSLLAPSWVDFKTPNYEVTFDAFKPTVAEIASLDGGVLVGGSYAHMWFPLLGGSPLPNDEKIDIGGIAFPLVGLGISGVIGAFYVFDP
jgi:outer membrane protein OmpA-like peptidoglycan-associated protein